MADNVTVTPGSGATIAADEVVDGTLGTVKAQFVKIMDGTLDGTSKAAVSASGLKVDLGADNDVVIDGTAVTRNSGAADAGTIRVTIDTGQVGGTGQAVPASSISVVGANWEIETVAASQTDQVLGATGATGDYLHEILVIPETTSPGSIVLEDNGTGAITLFTGGASSVATLHPFVIPVGWKSTAGAFSITTGTNIHLVAKGVFT